MALADLVPWVWAATALVAAVRWRGRAGGGFLWPGVAALLLASLHLWGWNKPIYLWGKQLMIWTGCYDDRLWFKLVLGLVFFAVVAWGGWRAWCWGRRLSRLQRAALLVMGLDAFYVAARTLSVDGWMPAAIGDEPGKSRLGAVLAALALALVFVAAARAPHRSESGHAPG